MVALLGMLFFMTPIVAFGAGFAALFNLNAFTHRDRRRRRIGTIHELPRYDEFQSQTVRWTIFGVSLFVLVVYVLLVILMLLR